MKNITTYLLLLVFTLSGFAITAQSSLHIGKFKVKKIDFSFGYESDYINGIDYNFFINQMPEQYQAGLSDLQFQDGQFHSGICENPSINLGLTLVHPSLPNLEWRNSLSYKPNRIDGVSYYNNTNFGGEYINLTGYHSEFAVESAAIFKLPVFSFFNLYGGAGINTGITSNNTICAYTSFDITADNITFGSVDELNTGIGEEFNHGGFNECYDTGSQLNQRVFLQLGTGFKILQRLEFGIDVKYGLGYRVDFGASLDQTNIVATNLNLRYILK